MCTGVRIEAHNAHAYNDNYRVEDADGLNYWMEHNQQEAKALAQWLSSRNGQRYSVVTIPVDTVKAAKAIRPNPSRHPLRDEAFRDMGVV